VILGKIERQLIKQWYHEDLNALRLKKHDPSIDLEFIIDQIKGRKKSKTKCPTWFEHEDVIFPPYLSMEQSSSERTAKRKASFFLKGRVLDMTGGMGIDACFISDHVEQYTLCEQQETLAKINIQNFKTLGRFKIDVHYGNSLEYLKETEGFYDTIYLDPARRNKSVQTKSNKVFFLEDCEPNVVEHWTSVKNEVKELLLIYEKDAKGQSCEAINLKGDGSESIYISSAINSKSAIEYSPILQYIYEPNKAILKANLQDQYHSKLGIKKLHPNTQFYTSETQISDYQGKSFEVVHELKSSLKAFKKQIPSKNLNVISRNHPLKAPAIEKKYQLNSGNDGYVIAFTDIEGKKMILTKLIP